ncbi:MAG: hypothetical protein IPL39_05370 [Opitutaceae bacterium]|nr:hypothetical protein [Opitutaceae bacterium]
MAVHPPRYPLLDARYWYGSIEHWTGEGVVFPFSIGRMDHAQLEIPGTVMVAFVVE